MPSQIKKPSTDRSIILLIVVSLLLISACSDHKGVDGVIYGGSIYTATDLKGVEAVAFDEGKIVYVGNKKHALSLTGGNTYVRSSSHKCAIVRFSLARGSFAAFKAR